MDADAIVVGAGLAGLAATAELARAGRRVLLLDQEPESNLGGQAFWSFGGLFLVGSPEQRRMGIRDSHALAWQDWMGSAFFDRGIDDPAGEDYWAYRWAQAYVDFAAGEKRSWLHGMGVRWLPLVGWAERGGYLADGHGNSVPASTSPGAPARPWWLRSSGGFARQRIRAWSGCGSGTGWTGSPSPAGRWTACGARSSSPARPRAAPAARASRPATSSCTPPR
jgi:choline dehydrogenase-like flavoprotein